MANPSQWRRHSSDNNPSQPRRHSVPVTSPSRRNFQVQVPPSGGGTEVPVTPPSGGGTQGDAVSHTLASAIPPCGEAPRAIVLRMVSTGSRVSTLDTVTPPSREQCSSRPWTPPRTPIETRPTPPMMRQLTRTQAVPG